MKIYKCDICGKEISITDTGASLNGQLNMKYNGLFGCLLGNKDICSDCINVGKNINFWADIKSIWQERAHELNDCRK